MRRITITGRKDFLLIRNRFVGFFIASVGMVGCMASISTAAASAELKGAGSSLVAPLMGNWINGFEARTSGAIKVVYGSVGTGSVFHLAAELSTSVPQTRR